MWSQKERTGKIRHITVPTLLQRMTRDMTNLTAETVKLIFVHTFIDFIQFVVC